MNSAHRAWQQLLRFTLAFWAISLLGCGPNKDQEMKARDMTRMLRSAKSLTIKYILTVGDPGNREMLEKSIPITAHADVKQLCDTIAVKKVDKPWGVKLARECAIEFAFPDGSTILGNFVFRNLLDGVTDGRTVGPVIVLADTKLYDKICQIISKKEGVAFDPVKDVGERPRDLP